MQGLGEASTETDISDTLEVFWDRGSPKSGSVLIVDDDPQVLEALSELLQQWGYQTLAARDGQSGKKILGTEEIGVLLADQRMPGGTGAELLAYSRLHSPCTTRILLTGNTDSETAMEAINRAEVFRLIQKPWDAGELLHTMELAMGHHQLVTSQARYEEQIQAQNQRLKKSNGDLELRVAERAAEVQAQQQELSRLYDELRRSFDATIKALISIMELGDFQVAEHCRRTAERVQKFGEFLGLEPENILELERAALLHWLGLINAPATLFEKDNEDFDAVEQATWEFHPLLGQQAIDQVPALKRVGRIILHYLRPYQDKAFQEGDCCEEGDGKLNAALLKDCQILAICSAFERCQARRSPCSTKGWKAARQEGLSRLKVGAGVRFCPDLVARFTEMIGQELTQSRSRSVAVDFEELLPGMVLAQPLETTQGITVAPGDTVITVELLDRLRRFRDDQGLNPIIVWQ